MCVLFFSFPIFSVVMAADLPLVRDSSIQTISTSGPKVCKCYLHLAIWIPKPETLNSKLL